MKHVGKRKVSPLLHKRPDKLQAAQMPIIYGRDSNHPRLEHTFCVSKLHIPKSRCSRHF